MPVLEVCCGDLSAVIEAAKGGAQRVELCSALSLDGLTPSAGLIAAARKVEGIGLHVLIRPREGDFVYTPDEFEVMRQDIITARQLGADGVVIGALTPEGDIDVAPLRSLMKAAEGLQVTFHRAFDYCRDPKTALLQIIELGCTRLLTSGQQSTAEKGISLIAQLVRWSGNRIIILPGAGVNEQNAHRILVETGASEIHSSSRSRLTPDSPLITNSIQVRKIIDSL